MKKIRLRNEMEQVIALRLRNEMEQECIMPNFLKRAWPFVIVDYLQFKRRRGGLLGHERYYVRT